MHFERRDGTGYLGLETLNSETVISLEEIFKVDKKNIHCASDAKVLLKFEDKFIISQYEEKSCPGKGEEMHATLLYTNRRDLTGNGHEILSDVYKYLRESDPSLSAEQVPTVAQISNVYQKAINLEQKFVISDVVFLKGTTGSGIIAKLLCNGKDYITDIKGNPISGGFLHISLVIISPSVSMTEEVDKMINQVVEILKKKLIDKSVKITQVDGLIDLEFGVTGSKPEERIRPVMAIQNKFLLLKSILGDKSKYKVIKFLGEGGEADVFLVQDSNNTNFAAKYWPTEKNIFILGLTHLLILLIVLKNYLIKHIFLNLSKLLEIM